MSYEELQEGQKSWAMQCALAIKSRREQIHAAQGKGESDTERDQIFEGLRSTRTDLDYYYGELQKMGLSPTEIEQLIQAS